MTRTFSSHFVYVDIRLSTLPVSTQVIFPPVALPALPHGAAKNLTPAFTYAFVANLLHWPAGVVPVTLVRPDEEVRTKNNEDG